MLVFITFMSALALAAPSPAALPDNGGFEAGFAGWRPLWTRVAGTGTLTLDHQTVHTGHGAARIEHHGEKDWSFEPERRIAVTPGDVFRLESWVKLESQGGGVTLGVSTWDRAGKVVDWSFGARSLDDSTDWRLLRSRFVIPDGVTEIQPRFLGHGAAKVWLDDVSCEKQSNVRSGQRGSLPTTLSLSNATLIVTLNPANATLKVCDRRTGRWFEQTALQPDMMVINATAGRGEMKLSLLDAASGLEVAGRVCLDTKAPEFTFELSAQGELPGPMRFPHPFASAAGEYLVVPMNEGISYPVEDLSIEPMRLVAYGGHGICMAFWGVTDGERGHMAILETPDDAAIHLRRAAGRLVIAPEWDAQRGQFGYTRRLRYRFFDHGGHVAIAKRYRDYAKEIGLFKSLEQKRRENPNVDLLVGAVNVWCWDRDAVSLVKDLQASGIGRILWSSAQSPENLRALNDLGVLTSRYDIYQDVMDPANFPHLRGTHQDWVTAAWPADIIRDASGRWLRGWGVKGRDGEPFSCGVLCDRRALDYAGPRISTELAAHPYRCRFIDTTTAAPWHECYVTNHPMTRTESKQWKMKLLDSISAEHHLVTGCETGHDAAVPYLHYFEGMMSLGPYRVPDAGRDMARIWTNAPERVVKFQLGHAYRLPLWELVFHDCVVAQWYWGDYNNKLPMLWDQRDLFNLLYGTPPMFMFSRQNWDQNRARFVQSYTNTCPYVRDAGYSEMTDHRFLTPDRSVQQTVFANGMKITVNFGPAPFTLPEGTVVAPLGFHVARPTAGAPGRVSTKP